MKKVLITGSSQGIGEQIAKTLFKNDYEIYLTGRNETRLIKISKELNNSKFLVCDLATVNAVEKLFEKFSDADILINNAGEYIYAPIEKTKFEHVEELVKLNIEVPFLLTSKFVKEMKQKKWGRIVNIGSISGTIGEANASLYSMTKSAFLGLTKSLALELAIDNITVNTICPGWVETALSENTLNEEEKALTLEMIPQRRFISPTEIANLTKYLISDEAKGLTGQMISLCAGLSAG